jgi:hypothetical protein
MFLNYVSGVSAVGIVIACGLDDRGSFSDRDNIFSSTPQLPDQLSGPSSLLCDGYQGLSGRGVKLTTNFHLVPRSTMVSYTSTPPYVFME